MRMKNDCLNVLGVGGVEKLPENSGPTEPELPSDLPDGAIIMYMAHMPQPDIRSPWCGYLLPNRWNMTNVPSKSGEAE